MPKAGKRVKKQIKRAKRKPNVKHAPLRTNVRELMLERMKNAALIPQPITTAQQQQQINEFDKLKGQVNIAEKGLSDERSKRVALEQEKERTKLELNNEVERQKELRKEIKKLKTEAAEKNKLYLEQEKELREKEAAETARQEAEAKLDESGRTQMMIKEQSEIHRIKRETQKVEYTNKEMEAKMKENEYRQMHEDAKKNLDKAKMKNEELIKVYDAFQKTDWAEEYKQRQIELLTTEAQNKLLQTQVEEAQKTSMERARLQTQKEYFYGTEEDRQTKGFIAPGIKAEIEIQKAILAEDIKRDKLRNDHASVFARAEQINLLKEKRMEAIKETQRARAELMIAQTRAKQGEFDEKDKLILSDEQRAVFQKEAESKAALDLQREKTEVERNRADLEKSIARENIYRERLKDKEHVRQIQELERQRIELENKQRVQEIRNQNIELNKKVYEEQELAKIRAKSMGIKDLGPYGVMYEEQYERHKAEAQELERKFQEHDYLIQKLAPYMNSLGKNDREVLQNRLGRAHLNYNASKIPLEEYHKLPNDALYELINQYEAYTGNQMEEPDEDRVVKLKSPRPPPRPPTEVFETPRKSTPEQKEDDSFYAEFFDNQSPAPEKPPAPPEEVNQSPSPRLNFGSPGGGSPKLHFDSPLNESNSGEVEWGPKEFD